MSQKLELKEITSYIGTMYRSDSSMVSQLSTHNEPGSHPSALLFG